MRARLPLALFTFAMLASPGCQTVETVYVYVTPTPGADGAVVGPAALPPDGTAPAAQVTFAPAQTPTPAPGAPTVIYVTPTPGATLAPGATPTPQLLPSEKPDVGEEGVGPLVTVQFPPEPPAEAFASPTSGKNTLGGGSYKVAGQVIDLKTRRGIGSAWIVLVSAADHAKRADVQTSASGAFAITGVPAGGYYAIARKSGAVGSQSPAFVNVGNADVGGVSFTLYVP